MIALFIDLIGVGVGALLRRVPQLTAGLPTAWGAERVGRRVGRIGRRRLGRVLRVLVEAGFQIAHPLPERGMILLELGDKSEQGAQGVLHER
jgi:hypothetical protein